jgi:oxygen-independent coproporphyrinogen III oxidase
VAGIYIHIPFCRQACSYCDFYFSTGLSNKAAIVKAITEEIRQRAGYLRKERVESVYFGGGTPSLLHENELTDILNSLHEHFSISPSAEITLEANPDDILKNQLQVWCNKGINRLSIGLQSFNDRELKWMNRTHTAADSLSSVKNAQDAGFGNISIDLIYGSKFQELRDWENTLKQAVALGTAHISSYNLTIEKKTALGVKHAKGLEPPVNDALSVEMFLMMNGLLCADGFVHYEVSNFARSGCISKHNSNYWLRKNYLGLGPSAHSFDGDSRQWNVSNNNVYIRAISKGGQYFEREELSARDQFNEYVLTRMRTIWGCDLNEIKTLFGQDVADHFTGKAARYNHLLTNAGDSYTLNVHGMLQADGIAAGLFLP